jgi:hypothetical protein
MGSYDAPSSLCPVCRREFPAEARVCPDDRSPLRFRGSSSGQLVGRYRILEPIGSGSAGTVYRANQVDLDRVVAVKIVAAPSEEQARRFLQEARAIAALHHPSIVHLFEVGRTAVGDLFMAMELLDGAGLDRVLASDAPLPQKRVLPLAVQVSEGLAAAHAQGIVHRDLKPANLFVVRTEAAPMMKILDFGLAKLTRHAVGAGAGASSGAAGGLGGDTLEDGSITGVSAQAGSPWYMSPEQCRDETIDHRADLYALGAVLYEMLTGAPPFVAPNLVQIMQMHVAAQPEPVAARCVGVHPALDALVLRLLDKDRARRPQTADIVAVELMRIARDLTGATALPPPAEDMDRTIPEPDPAGAAAAAGAAPVAPTPAAPAAPSAPAPGRGPTRNIKLARAKAGAEAARATGAESQPRRTVAFRRTDTDVDAAEEVLEELEAESAVESEDVDADSVDSGQDSGDHTVVDAAGGPTAGAPAAGGSGRRGPVPQDEQDWDSTVTPTGPDTPDATRPVAVPRQRRKTVDLTDGDLEILDLDDGVGRRGGTDGGGAKR